MATFDRFDVVSVPFPYTDRPVRQRRPAYEQRTGMITAAENRPWPGDVALADDRRAGLSSPSVIRPAKIATIEAAQASRIGSIGAGERRHLRAAISEILA
jgi:mRNA interferase MazF